MADYAGAVAAMKARFLAQWVTGPARKTPVAFQNEAPNDGTSPIAWPPVDGQGAPLPWVYFEVIGSGSDLRGTGTPGNNVWIYRGLILVHVYVPKDAGVEIAQTLSVAAGEIFRAATFYQDGQGAAVRTWSPRTDGGGSDADEGDLFRVTCSIRFEYFHHG